MGQKVHPIGFRVGYTRKWNNNWFALGTEWKKLFFYQREVEHFFKLLFHYYSYTKISRRKRVLLFDVKFFKYTLNKLFLFVFFYKLRTKRRKEVRPILKNTLNTSAYSFKLKKRNIRESKSKKPNLRKKYKFLLRISFWKLKKRNKFAKKSLNFIEYKI